MVRKYELCLMVALAVLLFMVNCASQKPQDVKKDVNIKQPQGGFCQSCSMPMMKPEDFGTNANGSNNSDYCNFCFQKGAFTDSNITMKQMINKVVTMVEPEMEEMIRSIIPTLKRWQKPSENK